MPEVSPSEFFKANAETVEAPSKEYRITDQQERYIEVTLDAIQRQELFNELNRLPAGFVKLMMAGDGADGPESLEEVENPEDIDIDADEGEILAELDGSVIDVFETLFAKSASHPKLTSMDMEELASNLDFEVLFQAGGEVINLSLESSGSITGFHEVE